MTCKDCYHYEACIGWVNEEALKEFLEKEGCEDFKDKSKIIELPCNVGDKIYIFNRNKTKVQEMVLDKPDIRCHCDKEHNLCMALCPDTKNGICAHRFNNDFREVGKTVFLTRDEAEIKLKEMSK